MDWGNSFQDILKNNKRRYVYFLYVKSLGNLITMETRERYNGSHANSVGCYNYICFQRFFLAPSHKDIVIQFHVSFYINKSLWS